MLHFRWKNNKIIQFFDWQGELITFVPFTELYQKHIDRVYLFVSVVFCLVFISRKVFWRWINSLILRIKRFNSVDLYFECLNRSMHWSLKESKVEHDLFKFKSIWFLTNSFTHIASKVKVSYLVQGPKILVNQMSGGKGVSISPISNTSTRSCL